MENLNKKDLEKVQGGYTGYDSYGYRSIENPEIGDRYTRIAKPGLNMFPNTICTIEEGPGQSYEYTING